LKSSELLTLSPALPHAVFKTHANLMRAAAKGPFANFEFSGHLPVQFQVITRAMSF
jgi:hypothetical protein